jgi:hypothetical protein
MHTPTPVELLKKNVNLIIKAKVRYEIFEIILRKKFQAWKYLSEGRLLAVW